MNDFDVSIFVITKNDDCIFIDDYDNNGDDVAFLCLTNDNLNSDYSDDNTICISANTVFAMDGWIKYEDSVPNAYCIDDIQPGYLGEGNEQCSQSLIHRSLNGYQQTQDILTKLDKMLKISNSKRWRRELTKEEYMPAIMYAYNTIISFNGKQYHGYLPSIGQLIYISENAILINERTKEHHIDFVNVKTREERFKDENLPYNDTRESVFQRKGLLYSWWSSTMTNSKIWYLNSGIACIRTLSKHEYVGIFPLFKIR